MQGPVSCTVCPAGASQLTGMISMCMSSHRNGVLSQVNILERTHKQYNTMELITLLCITSAVIIIASFTPALLLILKSKHVGKAAPLSILVPFTLAACGVTAYALFACVMRATCDLSIWRVLVPALTMLNLLICIILMVHIHHGNTEAVVTAAAAATAPKNTPLPAPSNMPPELRESLRKYDTVPVAGPDSAKRLPVCTGVIEEASNDYLNCLSAGYVHVDGQCVAPQDYGIVPGDYYLKRCRVSCGQDRLYKGRPLC